MSALYTANTAAQAPKSKKRRIVFTPEEDCWLNSLVRQYGVDSWDIISRNMIGRSPRQCRERWRSYLCPGLSNGPWTADEDQRLIELHHQHGQKWVVIASFFKGRSDINVKNRWYTFLSKIAEKDGNQSEQTKGASEISKSSSGDSISIPFTDDWASIDPFEMGIEEALYNTPN